jgi:hypothetical protein
MQCEHQQSPRKTVTSWSPYLEKGNGRKNARKKRSWVLAGGQKTLSLRRRVFAFREETGYKTTKCYQREKSQPGNREIT